MHSALDRHREEVPYGYAFDAAELWMFMFAPAEFRSSPLSCPVARARWAKDYDDASRVGTDGPHLLGVGNACSFLRAFGRFYSACRSNPEMHAPIVRIILPVSRKHDDRSSIRCRLPIILCAISENGGQSSNSTCLGRIACQSWSVR